MPGERRAGRRHGIGCAFDVVRSGDLDTARPLQVQDVSPHGEKMTATNGAKEQDTGSLEGPSALAPGMWWGRCSRVKSGSLACCGGGWNPCCPPARRVTM